MITISPQALFAGKAVFTVKSGRSGRHYTFQIWANKDRDKHFCSVRQGSEFTYVGKVTDRGVEVTNKSKFPGDSEVVRTASWCVRTIQKGRELTDGSKILNEGRCCRCGRELTHPESIKIGLGPECASRFD